MKIKDYIYNTLVRKNGNVRYEYERFVQENIEEHYLNRSKHWKILCKLIWHYRVKKRTEPVLYFDTTSDKKTAGKAVKKKKENQGRKKSIQSVYSNGPESEGFKRTYAHHIVKKYLEYDVIAFDLFDTLILRPFSNPADLFFLLGEQLGQRDFYKIRVEAEKRARDKAALLRGNSEVTIFDIWDEVEKRTGISAEKGVRKEFELEKKLCFANPYFKRVWEILKDYEKTIYVMSDMYYPKEMLKELLSLNGFSEMEDVVVSCDYNCNKNMDGALFRILLQKIKGKSVIHVGDNYKADITMAQRHGIETHYYKNMNTVGKEYRPEGMSELIGSAYAGIVNARLHCGLKRYDIYYEYGYVYGGIYVLGFVNYISNYCALHHIDKVLFLGKDGDVYQKVFHLIHHTADWEYVYWSKMESMIATIKEDRYSFVDRFLYSKAVNNTEITIYSLFASTGLKELLTYLKEYRINPEEYLNQNNVLILERLIGDHYEEIINIYKRSEEALKTYFKRIIGNAKKLVLVDAGWTGSNVEGLALKLTKDWNLCDEAKGILAASNTWNENITTVYDEVSLIQPYLFGQAYNREQFESFTESNRHMESILFEIFTQDQAPSFKCIDEKGRFVFDIPEVENYQIIQQIQKGILDFADEYVRIFGDYRIMMNISGHDAYMPFREVFCDLKYFRKFFSDFVFSASIFSDTQRQEIETLKDIFMRRV